MPAEDPRPRSLRAAWEDAAYGPRGFYRDASGAPERHFGTPVTASDAVARGVVDAALPTLRRLLREVDVATVTDVGAADGTLLAQFAHLVPADLAARIAWRGVDLRPRPAGLPEGTTWAVGDVREVALDPLPGVVVAHELLDDIPCEVVEVDDDGARRVVIVDQSGHQTLGPELDDPASLAWIDRWWPRAQPAARIEVGLSRDSAWRAATALVSEGAAIAVDYGHVRRERLAGLVDGGTLAGFRGGRLVPPRPDGSCNLTAHVAIDACAAATTARATRLRREASGRWWLIQRVDRPARMAG